MEREMCDHGTAGPAPQPRTTRPSNPWGFELRLAYPLSPLLPFLLFAFQPGVATELLGCEIWEQSHHIPN